MASWICRGCSAVYAVDADACPQCGANDPVPDYDTTVEDVRKQIAAKTAGTPVTAPRPDPQQNTSATSAAAATAAQTTTTR